MPIGLERRHETGEQHFVTASCFRRKPLLGTPALRNCFQQILIETSVRYFFDLTAYIVMPEHVHLVFREPGRGTVATVLQVLKQRYAVAMKKIDPVLYRRVEEMTAHPPPMPVWETRYYDFNLRSSKMASEKIAYIHQNPVARGLVGHAKDWPWSSYHALLSESERQFDGTR